VCSVENAIAENIPVTTNNSNMLITKSVTGTRSLGGQKVGSHTDIEDLKVARKNLVKWYACLNFTFKDKMT
jgi:hypothetical protein